MFTIPSRPMIDWTGYRPQDRAHQAVVVGKLNEFMRAPATAWDRVHAKAREFTTKDSTPDLFSAVNPVSVIQSDVGPYDFGWQPAFREIDLRQSNKGSFDIMDVSSALTFAKVREGEEAKIFQVSGVKTNVTLDLYGGGLAFSKKWWDDQDFYRVEQQAEDFRYSYYKAQATLFYGLIAAGTDAITYDTSDVRTMNNAVAEMLNENFSSLPVTEGMEFLIYSNPKLKERIAAALNAVTAYTAQKSLQFTMRLITTPHITSTTYYWVVAPGLKNQWGRRMDLTVLSDTDIYRYAENVVGWGRFGGSLNVAQLRRCALS